MKKIINTLTILAVAGIVMMTGCSSEPSDTSAGSEDDTVEELTEEVVPAFPAEYDGCALNVTLADTDEEYMTVYATYTNNNEEPTYALSSFVVKAYQGNIELEDYSDINGDEESLIQEVKDGESVDVTYKFKLNNVEADIELMVCTPTADEGLLAEEIYSLSED